MGQLDGRVALVTGGGRGIGRGICELLAAEGATVAVNYRRDADAAADDRRRHRRAPAAGQGISGVGRRRRRRRGAWSTRWSPSFGCVDILVYNAGIASRGNSVADTDPGELLRVRRRPRVRPASPLPSGAARACAPASGRHRDDLVDGHVRTTPANGAPYNMGKAAMEALAFTLAKEERRNGMHVNIVAPGLVETEMGVRLARGHGSRTDMRALDAGAPFGRVCQPIDVANVVLWLCSDGAGYVTGQRIDCDGGGQLMRY